MKVSERINNEDVLYGAIYENGEYVPVCCNRVTGRYYFADPVTSYNQLISELSMDDPIEVDFPDTVEATVSYSFEECLGVIYNGEWLAKLLDDETTTDIPVGEPPRVGDTFAIDIYGDYGEEWAMALILLVVMLPLLSHRPVLGEEQSVFFVDTDWSPIR